MGKTEQPTASYSWFEDDDCVASIEVYEGATFFCFYGANNVHRRSIQPHLIDAYKERLCLLFGPYNHFKR